MERVATYSHQNQLVQYMMRTQSKVAAAQIQASSGLQSTDYKGIADASGRLVNLEAQYQRSERYVDEGEVVNGRIETMYDAVDGMSDLIARLQSLTASLQGSAATAAEGVQEEMSGLMQEFAGLMNTQMDGRYLFAGAKTDTQPVTLDSATYTPITSVPSSADTSYYQGDDGVAYFQASDEVVIEYGITANDPAFEQALRAFNILSNMSVDPLDTDALAEADDLASSAADGLAVVQSKLGVASSTLERTIDQHVDLQLVLETQVDDIRSIDLAEASARLSTLEASLEATMSLMNILQKNNLSDLL